MAHDFWSKALTHTDLISWLTLPGFVRSCLECTVVLETFWRRSALVSIRRSARSCWSVKWTMTNLLLLCDSLVFLSLTTGTGGYAMVTRAVIPPPRRDARQRPAVARPVNVRASANEAGAVCMAA